MEFKWIYSRSQFLMPVTIKFTTFWGLVLCSLTEISRYLQKPTPSIFREENRGEIETVVFSETSVNFYQSTWRHIPKQ